jgi:hypothetical protein
MAAVAAAAGAITALGLAAAPAAFAQPAGHTAYLSHFSKLKTIVSTIPHNGDVNPYGIFVIRHSAGRLQAGNVLISNFNDKANLQGTGKTLVQITPGGHRSLFARISPGKLPGACPGGVGLSTALEVLPGGWVVVGSVPSTNGLAATAKAGCLIVLNSQGQVKETISGNGINGPWDSAAAVHGHIADLFVANVLNGTVAAGGKVVPNGYVQRLTLKLSASAPPKLVASTTIGSGYPQRTDPVAFVIGPTGVGLGRHDTLYVAETLTSRIFAIPNAVTRLSSAGRGALVTKGHKLNMPLGLAIAPNGHVLTVNGGNGKIVETTPAGAQIFSRLLDSSGSPKGAGALFGLAVKPGGGGVYYVDDAANTLRLLH